jgi:hypothetical protein
MKNVAVYYRRRNRYNYLMAWLFSKRYEQGLRDGKLKVSIPSATRVRIWKTLQNCDEVWTETTNTGWNYDTSTLQQLPESFKAEIGITELLSYPRDGGSPKPDNLESFVLRGRYPPHLLDMLELFYLNLSENRGQFQNSINEIMEEGRLSWRMANGKIFTVDPICEEITRLTYGLLDEASFNGALQEFDKARVDLTNGDYEGAITNANLAVESVCKVILGIEKAKPGGLYRALIDSGVVPDYYEGFLRAFEENILRCVAIMRNQEPGAGHGRGALTTIAPFELAELAVNLSAAIINFLIKQHLKKLNASTEEGTTVEPEDLPF